MAFSLSGNTITQTGLDSKTGNDTTVLRDIADTGLLEVFDESVYYLSSGERVLINGTIVDETGDFNLYLQNNAFFSVGSNQNGALTVGKRLVVNGKPQYSGGGIITVRPKNIGGIGGGRGYLHYSLGNSSGTASTGQNRFYDSSLVFYTLENNSRQDIYFTEISGCKIKGVQQGGDANNKYVVLRIQQGGRFDDNVVSDIKQFEFHATSSNPLVSFARNKFTNLKEGFISFSTATLVPVNNPNFLGDWEYIGWANNGGINFIDTYINGQEATEQQLIAKPLRAQSGGDETVKGIHFSKSHSETLVDLSGNPVIGDEVWFKNVHGDVFKPTVLNGKYSQVLKLKRNTNVVRFPNWSAGVWKDYFPIKKVIAGYSTEWYGEEFSTYDSFKGLGVASESVRLRNQDANITENDQSAVEAYTTISNSAQLYDRGKLHKLSNREDNGIQNLIVKDNQGNIGSLNITMNSSANNPTFAFSSVGSVIAIRTTQFSGTLKTTGTITIQDGVDLTGANLTGSVSKTTATDLTNITVNGNLAFKDNADKTITLTNSTIQKVANIGAGNIKIKLVNSTVADSSDSKITIAQPTFTITLKGITTDSSVYIADASKNKLHYAANQSGEVTFTTVEGYTGDLHYVVSKEGYTKVVGKVAVDGSTTSGSVSISQSENKDTNGKPLYQGAANAENLTITLVSNNINCSLSDVVTAQVFYSKIQAFLITENGCKWLVDNPNGDVKYTTKIDQSVEVIWERNIKFVNANLKGTAQVLASYNSQDTAYDDSSGGQVSFIAKTGATPEQIEAAVTKILGASITKVEELHLLQGLDAAIPLEVTTTERKAGSVKQKIEGDGRSKSTVTRVNA